MKNLRNLFRGAKDRYATRTAKGTFLALLLTTCAAFTACTDEVENISQESRAALQLNVGVNQPTSRAIVEGKALPNESQIGVSVVDATGTAYQEQDYNNVLYTAAEVQGKQTWSTTANVTLSGEEATLFAYYPYTAGADITAIPVDMTETDQKDWMYATPVTGLSDGKSTAEVQLNHALTDLRLTFYKDTYSGAGEVTEFTIQSTGLATGGTLNAKTGEITLPATPVNTITRTEAFTLTDKVAATPLDVMLIPTGTEAPVTVSMTVDGHTYSASTTAFTLQKAKAYNYVMKLTSTGLEVTSVALTDWNEELLPDATFEPGTDDSQDEDYSDWVKLIYNVTDVSQPTQIFFQEMDEFSFDITNVTEVLVIEGGSGTTGKEQVLTPSYLHSFSTTGKHTVYVKFADMTKIPDWAFSMCTSLVDFELPESVTEIGEYAFLSCYGLIKVTIPNSVKTIGEGALIDCIELMEVTIGEGVQTIGDYAFGYCTGLINVTIPNSVTSIGNSAFSDCIELTEVTIGEGVQTIGEYAFAYCEALDKITSLAMAAATVEDNTFKSVKEYGTLYYPEGAVGYEIWLETNKYYLGYYHWNYSESIQKELPDQAELDAEYIKLTYKVEDASESVYLFEYPSIASLRSRSVESFEVNLISDLIVENKIIAPTGYYDFTTPGTYTVYVKFKDKANIPVATFYKCTELVGIKLPETIVGIGERAFYDCTGLTSVTIPASVRIIEGNAFEGCKELKSIVVDENNMIYDSRKNCNAIIETATNTLVTGCKNTVIPQGILGIGDAAFKYCSGLTSVTIPETVKAIGKGAFAQCTGLTGTLSIPESVQTIGESAFSGCTGLTGTLTIPNSVEKIDEGAFFRCSGLKEVTIGSGVETIGERAFYECSGLTKVNIPESVQTISDYAFYGCTGWTGELNLPEELKTIGKYAFYKCTGLTGNLNIPNSVTTIKESAFFGCSGLTGTLTIPNSVKIISNYAFNGCSGLTSLIIGSGITKIDSYTFEFCSGLTSVTIPETVTSIGNSAFYNCKNITSVTIPNSVKSIGNWTFQGCSGLKEVTIGSGVETIGDYAFSGGTGMTKITSLATTAPNITVNTFFDIKSGGILYVPTGSTGYDTWTGYNYLGRYNWSTETITGE